MNKTYFLHYSDFELTDSFGCKWASKKKINDYVERFNTEKEAQERCRELKLKNNSKYEYENFILVEI